MQIDLTAMLQGIYDARDGHQYLYDDGFIDRLLLAIGEISYPGPVKRSVVDYDKLLKVLADIEPPESTVGLIRLWKYLGKSIGSGISVSYHPGRE